MPMMEEAKKNDVLSKQRLNPRRAARLRKKMDKWFSWRNPVTVEKEEVIVTLDLQCKGKKKYSDAEIDSAFKVYKGDSQSDS